MRHVTTKRPPLQERRPVHNRAQRNYFGWYGGTAGASFFGVEAGLLCPFLVLTVSSTEPDPEWRDARIESDPDVSMKMITPTVVALDNADAAPRGPKAV